MARTTAVVAFAATFSVLVGAAEKSPVDARNYAEGLGRAWVQQGVEGAVTRLKAASCRQLFSEFADANRVGIDRKLTDLGVTPEEYLLRWLWFLEGSREPPCRNQGIDAFTHPGSRLIYVCSSRVVANHTPDGDLVIIHEMLHSLGLPENPPAPREITKRVRERCGTKSVRRRMCMGAGVQMGQRSDTRLTPELEEEDSYASGVLPPPKVAASQEFARRSEPRAPDRHRTSKMRHDSIWRDAGPDFTSASQPFHEEGLHVRAGGEAEMDPGIACGQIASIRPRPAPKDGVDPNYPVSAETIGIQFARSMGIEGTDQHALAKLRGLSAEQVLRGAPPQPEANQPPYETTPILDGKLITETT